MNVISFGQWIVNPAFLAEIKALSGSERIKEWIFFLHYLKKDKHDFFFRTPVEYISIPNDSVRHSVGKFKENVLLIRAHYIHCLSVTSGTTNCLQTGGEKKLQRCLKTWKAPKREQLCNCQFYKQLCKLCLTLHIVYSIINLCWRR